MLVDAVATDLRNSMKDWNDYGINNQEASRGERKLRQQQRIAMDD